jgi:large subunit ribosomal protein L31
MKAGIHPDYTNEAKIICTGCGATFTCGSILPEVRVGVCNQCHPFYTGKAKLVDAEGRVDRFKRKYATQAAAAAPKAN